MKIPTGLIDTSHPVLVAISGGADSVALLHLLRKSGYRCVAAHCNFHLRGEESDSDEAFVRSLCDKMGVELHVAHFDTKAFAAERKISIEMAARDQRYEWFFGLLDEKGLSQVAVAHHADDAAETFLLNLTRGTGIRGLTGMKPTMGRVVRPLLGVSRQEIELYCKANGLSYVTDCTNAYDDYWRNRIRHHVIPQLKTLNPSFLATMSQNMAHLGQVMEVFAAQVERFKAESVTETDDEIRINGKGLAAETVAEPFLFEIMSPSGFSPRAIGDVARCVAEGRVGRVFHGDGGARALVDRTGVIIQKRGAAEAGQEIAIESLPFRLTEPLEVGASAMPVSEGFVISRDPMVMHVDADKVSLPISIRKWRQGDTFRPLGMKGFKKLSDFFVDSKMSIIEKEETWVMECAKGIICVLGRRIDDRFKMEKGTKRVMEVRFGPKA